jgi:hypothetical protein
MVLESRRSAQNKIGNLIFCLPFGTLKVHFTSCLFMHLRMSGYSQTRLCRDEGVKYVVSLLRVIITEEYNVTVNSQELIRTREYLTVWTRCRIERCRYNWVRHHGNDLDLF